MTQWLIIVGEETPFSQLGEKNRHRPYRRHRLEKALDDMKCRYVEGNLWVLDDDGDRPASDVRDQILDAITKDRYDRGQQRFIVVKYRASDSDNNAQVQFRDLLKA